MKIFWPILCNLITFSIEKILSSSGKSMVLNARKRAIFAYLLKKLKTPDPVNILFFFQSEIRFEFSRKFGGDHVFCLIFEEIL